MRKIVAVVDDDPSMLRALGILLDAHGFTTVVFESAEQFLGRGAPNEVACLLLDIQLGGKSGIELARQLRASGSTLPIVFMTALDDDAILQMTTGFTCLRKPFTAGQLMGAIEQVAA